MKRMIVATPTKRQPCLTELSTGTLAISAAVIATLLWLAIGVVI